MSTDDHDDDIIDFASYKSQNSSSGNDGDSTDICHRVQLDFSAPAYEYLKSIVDMSPYNGVAKTIRAALRIYHWYLTNLSEDKKVRFIVEGHGIVKEVELNDL